MILLDMSLLWKKDTILCYSKFQDGRCCLGVHIVIVNDTYGAKDIVKEPANSFPKAKKINTYGPVLSVVINYM